MTFKIYRQYVNYLDRVWKLRFNRLNLCFQRELIIDYNSTGVNITHAFFLAQSRFPAFQLKCPAFLAYFELGKRRSMRSAQRQVELGQLSNQLPVLGKPNSLCEVGKRALQPGTSMIMKLCISYKITN